MATNKLIQGNLFSQDGESPLQLPTSKKFTNLVGRKVWKLTVVAYAGKDRFVIVGGNARAIAVERLRFQPGHSPPRQ